MSAIEWGVYPQQSAMGMFAHDNTASPPTSILDASTPFFLHVYWEVPQPIASVAGGSFRIRAFAESMGPGQEKQLGATLTVPVVPNQTRYDVHITVPAGTLLGEGELFNGVPVSGIYKFVSALQHMNPGPNQVSGYCEGPLVQMKTP
ncbi:MAG: hypothetical protein KIT17_00030 [Rubrivivax sp.]|nr:hypothetical protein [Rubrivivax sp.]